MKEVMVVIKTGVYGYRIKTATGNTRVRPITKGERVSVSDEEAARLVGLGIAAYVDVPTEAHSEPPAPPSGNGESEGEHQDTSGTNHPAEPNPEDEKNKAYAAEVKRLERMSKDDLVRMAQDMRVDISGARNNHERAELIAAVSSEEEDDEDADAPSDLEDEDIVR